MNINDADFVLGFARQQSHILNARVYEIEYQEMDYGVLIPVNRNIPEWASGMDTLVMDKVGEAKFQSTYAKDVPLADVNLNMVSSTFAEYAVGYQWNIGEVGKAAFSNFPLSARRAEAARFAAEVFVWETALIGSNLKGWTGLVNNAAVTPVAASATGTASPNTAWVLNDGTGNKTPEEIVADINNALIGPVNIGTGIQTSILADTILLPALATAATVGVAGGGRMVAYRNTADVLELPMPMDYRFFPLYQDGPFNFTVPGMGRIGQLDVKKPGIRYLDGITPIPA